MKRICKDKRSYTKFTGVEEHDKFLSRISKTLYYTKFPVPDCLSLPVTELAAEIFTEVKNGKSLERLDVEEASRISRNACVSPCSLVLALLYLERLKDCNPEYLQRVAPSELFLVTLMVASKFLNDDGEEDEVFNTEWAYSGKLSTAKMNRLEKDFLKAIEWTVFVKNEDFWERLQRLEKDIAYKEAKKRGWFSYTELNTLLDSTQLGALVHTVLGVSSICIATYAVGLITLLGSAAIAANLPGALVSSKQQNLFNGKSNLKYSSSSQGSSQTELEEKIENILLDSISGHSEICNESYVNRGLSEKDLNNTSTRNSWEWIIDSVTFWLPNCSDLKSKNCLDSWKDEVIQNKVYITKTNFIIESDSFSRYSGNQVKSIVKEDVFDSNLQISSNKWNNYINYFSKVGLTQGQ